jgi:hypothetical protein
MNLETEKGHRQTAKSDMGTKSHEECVTTSHKKSRRRQRLSDGKKGNARSE